MSGHVPVLLDEVVEALSPGNGDVIVDATFGGGGYARRLLDAAECMVVGVDRDPDAKRRGEALASETQRFRFSEGAFGDLDDLLDEAGYSGVDGIVLDLGVSSFQIDEAERGFSFMQDGPLDMRMSKAGPGAADVVNGMDERDLANIIFRLGDEKRSRQIARAITQRRVNEAFTRTGDLAAVVEQAVGGRKGARTHPATRTFQAIRMFVNDELGELARALAASERRLRAGGRLVVVTFHSLEDRMVKLFLRDRSGGAPGGSRFMPQTEAGPAPSFELVRRKAVEPGEAEISVNPRARSSRLRAGIRTDAPPQDMRVETGIELPSLAQFGGQA